jgi:hypothetical protein
MSPVYVVSAGAAVVSSFVAGRVNGAVAASCFIFWYAANLLFLSSSVSGAVADAEPAQAAVVSWAVVSGASADAAVASIASAAVRGAAVAIAVGVSSAAVVDMARAAELTSATVLAAGLEIDVSSWRGERN